jgi:hypothetical protein
MPHMRTRQLVRDIIRKTPNPERRYINDRGTLITLPVRAHHAGLWDERVKRAEDAIARIPSERKMSGTFFPEGRDKYDLAVAELKTAKRIVAERNGRGEVCVVRVSPVKTPREWPNAVPGWTSPRRAKILADRVARYPGRRIARRTAKAIAEYMMAG